MGKTGTFFLTLGSQRIHAEKVTASGNQHLVVVTVMTDSGESHQRAPSSAGSPDGELQGSCPVSETLPQAFINYKEDSNYRAEKPCFLMWDTEKDTSPPWYFCI